MANALASAPDDSESSRAFLQGRVALFARVVVALGTMIQLLSRWVALSGAENPIGAAIRWIPNAHLLALGVTLLVLWRASTGVRGPLELRILDALCVLAPFAFACVALWHAAPGVRPNLLHVLSTGYVLILRSVLIPSSGRRTASIGLFFVVSTLAWTGLYYSRPDRVEATPPQFFVVATTVWSSMAMLIATVASHTIYGLRARVREARQLGQYRLVRKIGEGGMGVVYEARHLLLRRRTAIKLLPAEKSGAEAVRRFAREVRVTSTLTHPNTIAVFDYGQASDGTFYYAMEYLEGIDLQKLVERGGQLPEGVAAHVLEQICGALAEAHAAGLIHRDIKPANVILCERGGIPAVAKVLDFGLVKDLTPGGVATASTAEMPVGTPLYMSPEAIRDPGEVSPKSDLYALGAVGYFLVTGRHVFEAKSYVEVCAHHLHSEPTSPRELSGPGLSDGFESLVLGCLAKRPDARPSGASELQKRLASLPSRRALTPEALADWWQSARRLAAAAPARSERPETSATTVLNIELDARS